MGLDRVLCASVVRSFEYRLVGGGGVADGRGVLAGGHDCQCAIDRESIALLDAWYLCRVYVAAEHLIVSFYFPSVLSLRLGSLGGSLEGRPVCCRLHCDRARVPSYLQLLC